MSMFCGKICPLQLISDLDLLVWLKNEVNEGDEVPDYHPYNKEVLFPEPAEQYHMSYVNKHQSYFSGSQVASKQLNHQMDNRECDKVLTKIVCKEGVDESLFWLHWVKVDKKETQTEFCHSFCCASHQVPAYHDNQ